MSSLNTAMLENECFSLMVESVNVKWPERSINKNRHMKEISSPLICPLLKYWRTIFDHPNVSLLQLIFFWRAFCFLIVIVLNLIENIHVTCFALLALSIDLIRELLINKTQYLALRLYDSDCSLSSLWVLSEFDAWRMDMNIWTCGHSRVDSRDAIASKDQKH